MIKFNPNPAASLQPLKGPPLTPRAAEVARVVQAHGWAIEQEQANIRLLIVLKDGVQMNIYYSTMTVGTSMDHPTKGKTQIFRRNVTPVEFVWLLKNPRAHTGKGYHRRTQ